jgi:signal transduction histidine kinase
VPVQIKQLLSNLLLNSLKFRKQNIAPVIRLGCRRLLKQDVAKYRLDAAVNYFEITVEDNGIGFEEEYAERIFQMFQRLHGKAEYPGAGIGLALCKKIVENHHGIIFAKSRLDHGTVFSIILPEKQG